MRINLDNMADNLASKLQDETIDQTAYKKGVKDAFKYTYFKTIINHTQRCLKFFEKQGESNNNLYYMSKSILQKVKELENNEF